MAKKQPPKSPHRLMLSIAVSCSLAALLLSIRIIASDSARYIFLYWNLVLAAVPFLISIWLVNRIRKYGWLRASQVALTLVWFLFLPNSFYILTDFIHVRETYEVSLIYDIVMIASFVMSGLILGYGSIFLVQKELQKRLSERYVWASILAVFLLSSFAIYLGRYSRFNTWDIISAPAGLLFDVSDRVVNPAAHSETYVATLTVFVLLASVYWVVWEAIDYFRSAKAGS